jgi:hypothetical protein
MVALTLVGVVGVLVKLPWTYQSTGSVVFLLSKDSAKGFGGNPYLGFNSALNQTADIVRYEVMDVNTANYLKAHGYSSSYLVTDAVDTTGPVLLVQVTGHNKAAVEHTLYGVLNQVSTKLNSLQAGMAPGNQIRELVIATSPKATALVSKKARPLLEVLGLGVILTIGIPSVVDAVRTRRSDHTSERRDPAFLSEPGQLPNRPGYEGERPVRSGYAAERPDRTDHVGEQRVPAPTRPYDTADRSDATRRSTEPSERGRPGARARASRRP